MKYMHIRQPSKNGWDPKGGITIAYELEAKSRTALCGVSFCSPKDRYCKKTGRSIAGGRLKSQPLKVTITGVMTCFIIAQVIRTFLVEWEMANSPGPVVLSSFSDNGMPGSHRFSRSWGTKLIGPDGTVAMLEIDGNDTGTSGWVNLVPLWARKTGWTWI
tara:strand:+ start:95 stop:574 length:480 start_codon:yes stop_codon:yes gene_type:complete